MRFLFVAHNLYTDHTSGSAVSARVLLQWLAAAGHDCEALGTARLDSEQPIDIEERLAQLAVPLTRAPASPKFTRSVHKPRNVVVGRPTVRYELKGVKVTTLLTRRNDFHNLDPIEIEQLMFLLDEALRRFSPDVLITQGQPITPQEAMRRARRRGVATVFWLHTQGYDDPFFYEHADSALTPSLFLSEHYRRSVGLVSTHLAPPMEWASIVAPTDNRECVTMVNPSLSKGGALFARLAERLGTERPDIPVMAVLSTPQSHVLGELGIDFDRFPHFLGIPAAPRPADFYALTKILLVPSIFPEALGRVAAEALINGIPPLVSDRGGLAEAVDAAGRVLPLPAWMTEASKELPSGQEIQPWFEAVCELWDDPARYAEASELARQTGERLYREEVILQRYVDYFSSLRPGTNPLASA
jgi:glycosyltransferase involved in cell wall biosynthesis